MFVLGYFIIAFIWYRVFRFIVHDKKNDKWSATVTNMFVGIIWIISLPVTLFVLFFDWLSSKEPPTWL